jgi:hypothetical protein
VFEQCTHADNGRLKKAEIIPTVIDEFNPLLTLSMFSENATAELGNTIDSSRLQSAPDVQFINITTGSASVSAQRDGVVDTAGLAERLGSMQLTLAMTDPDAPSRQNPEWSEICHWILTDVPLIWTSASRQPSSLADVRYDVSKAVDLMPYKSPGPSPETGKHRYVFLAFAPLNGTTEKLHLKQPQDRRHWGYEKDDEWRGVRDWAEEMGLGVIGRSPSFETIKCFRM